MADKVEDLETLVKRRPYHKAVAVAYGQLI